MASLERRSTGLLDVVPWAYGFSHSWALRSLLLDPVDAEALLAKLPRIGTPPLQIEGDVIRESRLTGTRADLRFDVLDAEATPIPVAVETKVNDPYRVDQIERYIRH
ncbi:MAG: hypothetical protein ACXVHQ_41720, partial [Solirubrobacteraceae bacterium]